MYNIILLKKFVLCEPNLVLWNKKCRLMFIQMKSVLNITYIIIRAVIVYVGKYDLCSFIILFKLTGFINLQHL